MIYQILKKHFSHSSDINNDDMLANAFKVDFSTQAFCCYRHGFSPLKTYTNDCGWGCTIRSYQMLIGKTLLSLPDQIKEKFILENNFNDVLCHFLIDDPAAPFSIHNIVKHGEKYGKTAGEWFTPSEAVRAGMDCFDQDKSHWKFSELFDMSLVPYVKDDPIFPHLIIFTSRLCPNVMDDEGEKTLVNYFNHPACIGIVGGKKSSSFFFFAMNEKHELFYLDPHELRETTDNSFTFSGTLKDPIPVKDIDPSMSMGFLVYNEKEQQTVLSDFKQLFSTIPTHFEHSLQTFEEDEFCVLE